MGKMNVLAVGDVVGPESVQFLEVHLWDIRKKFEIEFAIINGENAAVGNGIDVSSARSLLQSGADVVTTGNHVFKKREIREFISSNGHVIRPANYPDGCPGSGYTIENICGYRVLVINVLGTVYLEALDNPFHTVDKILTREAGRYDFAIMDIHAEATAEKIAMARYFDGRISIIFGTHTHVQTADEMILPNGTGYITDVGMTGPEISVLGVRPDCIITKMMTKMPVRFEVAEGHIVICGAVFTLDTDTGRVVEVHRICEREGTPVAI